MRLWTVHPKYLDRQGLLAVWREGLLAQAVLAGQTQGYRHHPQLHRFRAQPDPLAAMGTYLAAIQAEAAQRGYRFDASKIHPARMAATMAEHDGQLQHEWQHLLAKLAMRDPARHQQHLALHVIDPHSLFYIVPGPVQAWEKV